MTAAAGSAGTFSLAGPEERARLAGLASVIRLGTNESAAGPSPSVRRAIRAEAKHASVYGDPSVFALTGAIAKHHGVAPENVLVASGIDELLGLAVRALMPNRIGIATAGQFPTFQMHVEQARATLHRVPYRADARVDLDGYLQAAREHRDCLIFLPNPDNPSGSFADARTLLRFYEALPSEALLIHDEAYAAFVPPEARLPEDTVLPRLIRMRTFSKEHGLAGMRVGYAIAEPAVIRALDGFRLLYGVGRVAQAAALAALRDGAWAASAVRRIAEGRRHYEQIAAGLHLRTWPSATNFVLFDFETPARAEAVMEALLRAGIHVRKPGAPPIDSCLRVSVGARADRDAFGRALAEILPGFPAA